jgi:hypothetical protein
MNWKGKKVNISYKKGVTIDLRIWKLKDFLSKYWFRFEKTVEIWVSFHLNTNKIQIFFQCIYNNQYYNCLNLNNQIVL